MDTATIVGVAVAGLALLAALAWLVSRFLRFSKPTPFLAELNKMLVQQQEIATAIRSSAIASQPAALSKRRSRLVSGFLVLFSLTSILLQFFTSVPVRPGSIVVCSTAATTIIVVVMVELTTLILDALLASVNAVREMVLASIVQQRASTNR